MKNYEYVLFDLDGTITQSGQGVLHGLAYAMKKMSMSMPEDVPPQTFIGPPLSFSINAYCHVPKERVDEALVYYREYYVDKGIFECELYDGVEELLKRLYNAGKKLLVASSKSEPYVIRILRNFDIHKYFTFVGGSDFEGLRADKTDVIMYTLKSAGVTDISTAVMVGDRKYDIYGAKDLKMDSIGVTYGYGSEAELREAGATYIAHTAEDVWKMLIY